jgi:hypothetical protein
MLWASPVGRYLLNGENVVGMERFFEANKALVMGWIWRCQYIAYIHEILGHLGAAQAEEPKIGPLWRAIPPQEGDDPLLAEALYTFDSLIRRDVTPEQHCKLIDLICQDLALGPPEAFKGCFTDDNLKWISRHLHDPCLRLLGQFYARLGGDSFYLSSRDIDGPLKESWARIATYFMTHPERTSSPSILRLQGALWPVIPNRREFCLLALKDSEVLVSGPGASILWSLNPSRLIYSACSNTPYRARSIATLMVISSSISLRTTIVSQFLWI